MSLFSFSKPKQLAALQEQGGEALGGVKAAATQALSHAAALWQLLQIELQEYASRQAGRVVAIVLGGALLLVGYLLLCAFACVAAHAWLGSWLLATGLVCLLHLVAGAVLLLIGIKRQPGEVAPATKQELIKDWQCIKLLLSKENKKS